MSNPNLRYIGIGALCVIAAALGYMVYQDQQESSSVSIQIGESGVSIKGN